MCSADPSGCAAPGGARVPVLTTHECRHVYASHAIAAGVNAKTLSTYMGHANIAITFDLYGHLMPGTRRTRSGCWTPTTRGTRAAHPCLLSRILNGWRRRAMCVRRRTSDQTGRDALGQADKIWLAD
jgi:hypothetical protein